MTIVMFVSAILMFMVYWIQSGVDRAAIKEELEITNSLLQELLDQKENPQP